MAESFEEVLEHVKESKEQDFLDLTEKQLETLAGGIQIILTPEHPKHQEFTRLLHLSRQELEGVKGNGNLYDIFDKAHSKLIFVQESCKAIGDHTGDCEPSFVWFEGMADTLQGVVDAGSMVLDFCREALEQKEAPGKW